MAAFATHLTGGFIATGILAAGVQAAELATPWEMLTYLALGTAGSLLPDLDLPHSTPTRLAFTALALTCAFSVVFLLAAQLPSVIEKLLAWVAVYLSLRTVIFPALTRFTHHRGLFHSVPAAAFFGMFMTLIATYLFNQSAFPAWLSGLFVTYGYLIHLLLDELNSVDFVGRRLRRSFGTALKFWSRLDPAGSFALYCVCVSLFLMLPDPQPLLDHLSSAHTYARLSEHLFPANGWVYP